MNFYVSAILLGVKDTPHGGSLVGFYGRDGLADSVGVSADGSGFKPAGKLQWGGHGGSFGDPDGYIWSIGYSAEGRDQAYAE